MKFAILLAAFVSASSAFAAPCSSATIRSKASKAAVAIEQINRNGERVSVVTADIGSGSRDVEVSVQVRGSELGGQMYDIVVDTVLCAVGRVELGETLE